MGWGKAAGRQSQPRWGGGGNTKRMVGRAKGKESNENREKFRASQLLIGEEEWGGPRWGGPKSIGEGGESQVTTCQGIGGGGLMGGEGGKAKKKKNDPKNSEIAACCVGVKNQNVEMRLKMRHHNSDQGGSINKIFLLQIREGRHLGTSG